MTDGNCGSKAQAAGRQVDRRAFLGLAAGGALLATALVFKARPALSAAVNAPGGLAVQGFDVVAYFTQNAAVNGSPDIAIQHDGATWRFASVQNRDTFLADPGKYAPQYGGFCAYAVANGYTAKIDPQAFTVVDGALYLNFSKSVRTRWERDIPGHISKANANWPGLSGQ